MVGTVKTAYIHACIHACIRAYTFTWIHTDTDADTIMCSALCVCVCIYLYIYIYIHIRVYRADLSLLVLFFDCDFTTKHRHDFTRSRRLQVEHEIIIGVSYIPQTLNPSARLFSGRGPSSRDKTR